MECEPRRNSLTRTSSGIPFSKIQFQKQQQSQQQQSSSIAPYPISETDAEIKERQKLTESVPNWNNHMATPDHQQQVIFDNEQDSHSMMEVTATEEALDDVDDDFSLSGDASLAPEDKDELELERIDDPVSFWEEATPTTR